MKPFIWEDCCFFVQPKCHPRLIEFPHIVPLRDILGIQSRLSGNIFLLLFCIFRNQFLHKLQWISGHVVLPPGDSTFNCLEMTSNTYNSTTHIQHILDIIKQRNLLEWNSRCIWTTTPVLGSLLTPYVSHTIILTSDQHWKSSRALIIPLLIISVLSLSNSSIARLASILQ